MFSAFTSYLFGDGTDGSESQDNSVDFTSVQELTDFDGEWVLVANSNSPEESCAVTREQANDPITAKIGLEESWYVTPPSCFGGREEAIPCSQENQVTVFENLLIEHPSMSVYGPRPVTNRYIRRRRQHMSPKQNPGSSPSTLPQTADVRSRDPSNGQSSRTECTSVTVVIPNHNNHIEVNRLAARLSLMESRKPLRQLNCNPVGLRLTRKGTLRNNLVHTHQSSRKRNKQQSRMAGKHVGMVGKRGTAL